MRKAGIILLIAILGGCMRQSGSQMLTNSSSKDYAKSRCSKWIAIPQTADQITAFGFFGFDTNYRFLKCSADHAAPSLPDLISQSLALQPRKTNDTFILVGNANITMDGMQSVFGGFPGSVPTWWKTDFSRFDQQSFCAWQSTNNYGYGYIYLYDSKQNELRAFQWSQQWNTVEDTIKALKK